MRVVVIGGTGWMGSRVVERLAGNDVVVVHRNCDDASHVHADRNELAGLRADVVIDMIPMTERDATSLVAANIAPRLVIIGSSDVYRQYDRFRGIAPGDADPTPLAEDAPLRENLYPYGGEYDKILVERVVMREPGATVLRLPVVYGPGDQKDRLRHWKQPRVVLREDQARWRWTRGYVDNVVDAIILAATDPRAAGKIFNLGEPDAPTEAEWAGMVGAEVELAQEVKDLPPYDWRCDLVTDTGKIRHELGYAERVSREEAIRRTKAAS